MPDSVALHRLTRRHVLIGVAATAAATLLAACGQEPTAPIAATNGSSTPAPTRIVVIPTPLPPRTPPPPPTPTPPSPVEFILTIRQPGMLNPGSLALDGQDNLYVTSNGSGEVYKFTSDGRFLLKWGKPGRGDGEFAFSISSKSNTSIATDRQGGIYVADASNRIQRFDGTGNFLSAWGSKGTADGQFDGPDGIAVDDSGVVYVADRFNNRAQRFDASGNFLGAWGRTGSGDGEFDAPTCLAFDRQGRIYITEYGNNRIQKFDHGGAFLGKWGHHGTGDGAISVPIGITLDRVGSVYVVDNQNNRVEKFDGNGTYLMQWGGKGNGDDQFVTPIEIKIDTHGDIYVTDWGNNRVQKFHLK